jgi:3-oxoacyl-[acyl-carrier protein] reductase
MDLNLKGKVALVTGAGSQIGFGRTIALTLAKEGCNIIVNDVDMDGAKQTVSEIKALSCKAIALKADVSSRTEVFNMVKEALAQFGRIDILVNNAGIGVSPGPFIESNEAEWDKNINVNFKGVMYCTKAVLNQMISNKYGKIINISSGAGLVGTPMVVVYSGVKAAVIGFTKGLAKELSPLGINVNCIAPGLASTGFTRNVPDSFKEQIAASVPVKRLTVPQDIASMVAYLASDVASDIVGQTFFVSGEV